MAGLGRYMEASGKEMKEIGTLIIGAIVVIGILAGLSFASYYGYAYFAPKYEAVRRDTMIESRQYNEATVRELYRFKRQYDAAQSPEQRATIALSARHEFEIFPEDRLPPELHAWMQEIR